jgi:hypothetical protein
MFYSVVNFSIRKTPFYSQYINYSKNEITCSRIRFNIFKIETDNQNQGKSHFDLFVLRYW